MRFVAILFLLCVVKKSEENQITNQEFGNKRCIKSLLNLERVPLVTRNCCLTLLCLNGTILKQVTSERPSLTGLFRDLCRQQFYMRKEQSSGCVFEHNLNTKVNKNTNSANIEDYKESSANCSANFRTINGETAPINSRIRGKRSTEGSIRYTFESPTSTSYVQAPNSRRGDKKIRFENITKISAGISGLQFLDVPKGDEMRIHNLRLEQEYLLFEVFSDLMAYLQLDEFPTDFIRDALQNQVPFHLFAFQLVKMETAALGWAIIWTVISLCVPFILIIYLCCSNNGIQRLNENASDVAVDFRDKCVQRTLRFLLHFFLTLMLIPIILIIIANEQISRQMSRSIFTANVIFGDLNTFIRNTHMQISFVATSSTDITLEEIRKDLEDVEKLLGYPYQRELAAETGIDIALDALDELRIANGKVTLLVVNLLSECALADAAARLLQEKLKEVSRQLTIARQQCRREDQALCYTLQFTGLDVVFSCEDLALDLKIKHLERMEKEKLFNNSVESAHITFKEVPRRVTEETVSHITEIKKLLTKKRTEVYKAVHSLDVLSRSLSETVTNVEETTMKALKVLNDWELWRWLIILGISIALSLLWALLFCAAPCGCGLTSRTIPLLLSGIIFISLMCLIVWSLETASFLLGHHADFFLCRPLYDHPRYEVLGKILNSGGILYTDSGVFKAVLKGNDSLELQDVLKSCQRNQPAYSTFHLHNFFDTNSVTNYKSWNDFKTVINNLAIDEKPVEILSPSLQLNLQVLSNISSVNLTKYRVKISGPVTKRDLSSLADQLNNVARQLTDLSSSRRINDLATTLRKIIQNEMKQLSELKNRILYKITALDVLIHPLSKQANQSLTHLKAAQYYVDNQRRRIAEKVVKQYIAKLNEHLEKMHNYIFNKVTKEIGKCRPLWDIFHAIRFSTCKLIVDPTNGVCLSSTALILLFLGIVLVTLRLVEHYRELISEELLTSATHRRARDGLIIDNEGSWATPSETSPDNGGRQEDQSAWTTPNSNGTSEPLIPPPPRVAHPLPSTSTKICSPPSRLSTIASRISAVRVPQIPSVSRTRSPKRERHESLRLIEPICWKSGTVTPRSWL